jgi:hypothetical protein
LRQFLSPQFTAKAEHHVHVLADTGDHTMTSEVN